MCEVSRKNQRERRKDWTSHGRVPARGEKAEVTCSSGVRVPDCGRHSPNERAGHGRSENHRALARLQRPANLGVLQLTNPPTAGLIDNARSEGFGRLDGYGQVSPDGRWLLYGSNESGRWEVYVQRFLDRKGGKWKISDNGAISPRWSRDGHELFYVSTSDSWIVSVPIATTTDPVITIGAPVSLFKANLFGGSLSAIHWRTQYAVAGDHRFLINEPLEDAFAHAPITVVTNWMASLRK